MCCIWGERKRDPGQIAAACLTIWVKGAKRSRLGWGSRCPALTGWVWDACTVTKWGKRWCPGSAGLGARNCLGCRDTLECLKLYFSGVVQSFNRCEWIASPKLRNILPIFSLYKYCVGRSRESWAFTIARPWGRHSCTHTNRDQVACFSGTFPIPTLSPKPRKRLIPQKRDSCLPVSDGLCSKYLLGWGHTLAPCWTNTRGAVVTNVPQDAESPTVSLSFSLSVPPSLPLPLSLSLSFSPHFTLESVGSSLVVVQCFCKPAMCYRFITKSHSSENCEELSNSRKDSLSWISTGLNQNFLKYGSITSVFVALFNLVHYLLFLVPMPCQCAFNFTPKNHGTFIVR